MKTKTVEEVYAKVPHLACKGLCFDQCSAIPVTNAEMRHLGKPAPSHTSLTLNLSIMPGESKPGAEGLKRIQCPLLTEENKCSRYDKRPLICRLWGVAKGMPCPHGCQPERVMADAEAFGMISEIERMP